MSFEMINVIIQVICLVALLVFGAMLKMQGKPWWSAFAFIMAMFVVLSLALYFFNIIT